MIRNKIHVIIFTLFNFLCFNFVILFCADQKHNQNDWTWSYRKKFHVNEARELSAKSNLIFSKTEVPQYNQLVFCWNSYRPKEGHIRFSVQARHAITKEWGNWYKMVDWGNGIQKSHCTILDGDTSYIYVRLELPSGKSSDGFRLKIESQKGADLSNIRLLGVCISNFSKFTNEKISPELLELPSIFIEGVPKKSQMVLNHVNNKKMCSPTSTSMLISYLTNKDIDSVNFSEGVYDNGLEAYGSWPFNTAHAFEKCPTCFFRVSRLNSFSELHLHLSRGIPVVVSVRGKLMGAPQDYNSGHLLLIIGWDGKTKKVIVHDPAFEGNDKVQCKYDLAAFLQAWERSHRLAYIFEKR